MDAAQRWATEIDYADIESYSVNRAQVTPMSKIRCIMINEIVEDVDV
jgi:hypothetical protein